MTLSDKRRAASLARKTRGGNPKPVGNPAGRPRSGERCPCGANTARRAKARGYDCCKRAGISYPTLAHSA